MIARLFPFLFGLAGLAMLAGCLSWAEGRFALIEAGARTEGVVIALDRGRSNSSTSYFPIVRFYTTAGRKIEFRGSVGTDPSAYSVGEEVSVVYRPDQPGSAQIDSFLGLWLGPLILGFMGMVFSGLGFGSLVWQVRRARLEAWLRRHGREVKAKIVGVTQAGRGRRRRKRRLIWHISAQWLDPAGRQVHLFKSPALRFDPAPFLKDETIPVTLDPDDPKRYAMDLSALPRMAGQ